MLRLLTTVLFISLLTCVYPARILGVYFFPSISHQVVYRSLTLELVKRGHEVVTITSDPVYKNEESPANLIEIDISDSYKLLQTVVIDAAPHIKRGVIIDYNAMIATNMTCITAKLFDYPEIENLIKDKDQKFDLVIAETLSYIPLMFSKIFNAPAILFSSLYGMPSNYEVVGAVTAHPILYPSIFRNKFRNLSILDKIKELYVEFKFWKFDKYNEQLDNAFLRSRFGSDAATIEELKKKVALLFVNAHPIFDGNRPVSPGTVYLGALHLKPTKELSGDLKSYLDKSTRGVVYVSLGTNVRPAFMEKELLNAFLEAFKRMPYDILWKFEGVDPDRIPKNVKMQKWFPQRDLLGHPKIKVFVMQGGLQSTDEAIDSEVPLVGIPMLGDQWFNVNKYEELGIGVAIDSYTMVADDLVNAVHTVANDPSYKANIKSLKAVMQDQPEKPLERAVWWTEHVLRHKGSRHLLGAAANMSWSEYLMLDVVAVLAIAFTVFVAFVLAALYFIVTLVSNGSRVKVKQN